MAILAYGVNYRTAPVEFREKIAFPEETVGAALQAATRAIPSVSEAAIISTCNRTELYLAMDPNQEQGVVEWLADARAIQPAELEAVAYSHWDQDAAKHLIRVAAGLDSEEVREAVRVLDQARRGLGGERG